MNIDKMYDIAQLFNDGEIEQGKKALKTLTPLEMAEMYERGSFLIYSFGYTDSYYKFRDCIDDYIGRDTIKKYIKAHKVLMHEDGDYYFKTIPQVVRSTAISPLANVTRARLEKAVEKLDRAGYGGGLLIRISH